MTNNRRTLISAPSNERRTSKSGAYLSANSAAPISGRHLFETRGLLEEMQ